MNHADYFVGTTNSGLPHIIDVLRYAVRPRPHFLGSAAVRRRRLHGVTGMQSVQFVRSKPSAEQWPH